MTITLLPIIEFLFYFVPNPYRVDNNKRMGKFDFMFNRLISCTDDRDQIQKWTKLKQHMEKQYHKTGGKLKVGEEENHVPCSEVIEKITELQENMEFPDKYFWDRLLSPNDELRPSPDSEEFKAYPELIQQMMKIQNDPPEYLRGIKNQTSFLLEAIKTIEKEEKERATTSAERALAKQKKKQEEEERRARQREEEDRFDYIWHGLLSYPNDQLRLAADSEDCKDYADLLQQVIELQRGPPASTQKIKDQAYSLYRTSTKIQNIQQQQRESTEEEEVPKKQAQKQKQFCNKEGQWAMFEKALLGLGYDPSPTDFAQLHRSELVKAELKYKMLMSELERFGQQLENVTQLLPKIE